MLDKVIAFCEAAGLPTDGWRDTRCVPDNPCQIFDRFDGSSPIRVNFAYVTPHDGRIRVYEYPSCVRLAPKEAQA